MVGSKRRRWEQIAQIVTSVLIPFLLFNYVGFGALDLALVQAQPSYVLVAFAIMPVAFFPRVFRWGAITNQGEPSASLWDLYQLTLVGVSLNLLLPASLGDIAKSCYGYKHSGLKEEMLSSTLVDKFIALFSIFLLGSAAALSYELRIYAGLSALLCVVFAVLSFAPDLLPWSLPGWAVTYVMFYLVWLALPVDVRFL